MTILFGQSIQKFELWCYQVSSIDNDLTIFSVFNSGSARLIQKTKPNAFSSMKLEGLVHFLACYVTLKNNNNTKKGTETVFYTFFLYKLILITFIY